MTILRPKQLQALLYGITAINSFTGRYNYKNKVQWRQNTGYPLYTYTYNFTHQYIII